MNAQNREHTTAENAQFPIPIVSQQVEQRPIFGIYLLWLHRDGVGDIVALKEFLTALVFYPSGDVLIAP